MIDLKHGLRVCGHPLHPILSDFPIPLLGTALLWDSLGYFRGEAFWWAISFWNICLGLAFAVLTAATGVFDYTKIAPDSPAVEKATAHMLLMISAVSCFLIGLVARGGAGEPTGWKLACAFLLDGMGLACLMAGGWFGGELTVKYGLGRDLR